MKVILGFISAIILFAATGCDWDHDEHHHHEGGYYGGYSGEYPNGYYGHGEHRDWNWH